MNCTLGVRKVIIAADDNKGGARISRRGLTKELRAIHHRHLHINKNKIRMKLRQKCKSLLSVRSIKRLLQMPFCPVSQLADRNADRLLIVNNHYLMHLSHPF